MNKKKKKKLLNFSYPRSPIALKNRPHKSQLSLMREKSKFYTLLKFKTLLSLLVKNETPNMSQFICRPTFHEFIKIKIKTHLKLKTHIYPYCQKNKTINLPTANQSTCKTKSSH